MNTLLHSKTNKCSIYERCNTKDCICQQGKVSPKLDTQTYMGTYLIENKVKCLSFSQKKPREFKECCVDGKCFIHANPDDDTFYMVDSRADVPWDIVFCPFCGKKCEVEG